MNELTHLDLCTGLGMFTLAAEWAQFRTIGFAEVDPYCNKVLARRWPHVPNFGDIKTADWAPARNVCLLTAGYPCQPFSTLGQRRGENDPRHLWPSVRRAIKETGPDWFVGENVIGHLSLGLDQVLSDLEDDGYSAQPITIPACAVGADFIGERIWILASSRLLRLGGGDGAMGHAETWSGPDINRVALPPLRAWSDDALPKPRLFRAGTGAPTWTQRNSALGNVIVPQVAYPILSAIRHLMIFA